MANGLDALHRHVCPNTTGLCKKMRSKELNRTLLLEFLRNVTYIDAAFHFPVSFNAKQEVDGNYTIFNFRRDNGSYKYIQVGSWVSRLDSEGNITGNLDLDDEKIRWANGNTTIPLSTCRPKCRRNQISRIREDKCCHVCETCGTDAIVVNNTCQTCPVGYKPNLNVSRCMKLPLEYVNVDTPLSQFLVFAACLGIVIDGIVFAIFLKNSNNKLIKASGRDVLLDVCRHCYSVYDPHDLSIEAHPRTVLLSKIRDGYFIYGLLCSSSYEDVPDSPHFHERQSASPIVTEQFDWSAVSFVDHVRSHRSPGIVLHSPVYLRSARLAGNVLPRANQVGA